MIAKNNTEPGALGGPISRPQHGDILCLDTDGADRAHVLKKDAALQTAVVSLLGIHEPYLSTWHSPLPAVIE